MADRDAEAGEETAHHIWNAGGESLFVKADVSVSTDVEKMVRATVETFGGLHCASNIAATDAGGRALQENPRNIEDGPFSISFAGLWLCMRYEIPAMLEIGGGSIINIASCSDSRDDSVQGASSAPIGGVIALNKAVAAEYARRGIRVNALCPGGVQPRVIERSTRRIPVQLEPSIGLHAMRRLDEPEEIAHAVTCLCSDHASPADYLAEFTGATC